MFVEPSSEPVVLAILPTLAKNLDFLLKCVQAVKDSDFPQTLSFVVIVNDPDVALDSIDDVTIISPGLNLGFNGGLLFGSQIFESEFIWILQDDVLVKSNTLSILYKEIVSNPNISMLSPRRMDSQGNYPACGGWTDNNGNVTGLYSEDLNESRSYRIPRKLNWVASSGSLIRKETWKTLRGYDIDLYPVGFGDVDFCDRAATQGYEFGLSDWAIIEHQKFSSSTGSLLREFTYSNTSQIFAQKKQKNWATTPISPLIDPELIAKIAQNATRIIPKLATYVSDFHPYKENLEMQENEIKILRTELHQANLALEAIAQSRIWRISRPYRALRRYLKI